MHQDPKQGPRGASGRRASVAGKGVAGNTVQPVHSTVWVALLGRARVTGALWEPCGSPRPQQALPGAPVGNTTLGSSTELPGFSAKRVEATILGGNKQTNKQRCYAKRETRNQWVPAQQNTRLCQCQHEASERASERAFRAPRPDCLQREPVCTG